MSTKKSFKWPPYPKLSDEVIVAKILSFLRSASDILRVHAVCKQWKFLAWKNRSDLVIDNCREEKNVFSILSHCDLTSLQRLSMRGGFQLTSSEIIDLISSCKQLRSVEIDIYLWSPRPTWQFVQSFVTSVTSLSSFYLSVPGRFEFTDEWTFQTKLTSLSLWLPNSKFRDFNWVSRMTGLCHLMLRVPHHQQLETLGEVVSSLTRLTSLTLECPFLKGFHPQVAHNLKNLSLIEPTGEDAIDYLSEFNSLRGLTVLNFHGPSLQLWSAISTITSLQRLYVHGSNGDNFQYASTLVNLTHLELISASKMTAEDFATISNFTSLRYLRIDRNTQLTDEVLTALTGQILLIFLLFCPF
jgi:hypothetical protein